jgi:hypothetical protein
MTSRELRRQLGPEWTVHYALADFCGNCLVTRLPVAPAGSRVRGRIRGGG